jgi:hypothetical protein
MPKRGLCTDLTCDQEIKPLYECHCCSWFICFNHLNEHVQKAKNKERLVTLKNELITGLKNELITLTDTLEIMIRKQLLVIEREKQLIKQAKQLLGGQSYSIDVLTTISEEMNQAIASHI